MNVQDDFVNQISFEKTFGQFTAAEDYNAFTFSFLQFRDKFCGVLRDDLEVSVGLLLCRQSLFQRLTLFLRARKHVILRAGIRSLARGQHYFESLATDQESVD